MGNDHEQRYNACAACAANEPGVALCVVVLALGYWWLRRDQTTDAPAATQVAPAG